ncbi:MAG: hypothetical protein M1834_000565 [Cirrosporium novae-zelandiae]|nr:MAG: hypothetical protein M1834_000565 [Cirrosporium novae-zelandiae]
MAIRRYGRRTRQNPLHVFRDASSQEPSLEDITKGLGEVHITTAEPSILHTSSPKKVLAAVNIDVTKSQRKTRRKASECTEEAENKVVKVENEEKDKIDEKSEEPSEKFQEEVEKRTETKVTRKTKKDTKASVKNNIKEKESGDRVGEAEDRVEPEPKKKAKIPIQTTRQLRHQQDTNTELAAPDYVLQLLPLSSISSQHGGKDSPNTTPTIPTFQSWADELCRSYSIEKMAEGSFGEVYEVSPLSKRKGNRAKLEKVVFKIMPIRPPSGIGSRKFASPAVVVSEVEMLRRLDPVPGFSRFRELFVLCGAYPDQFKEAWKKHKKRGGRSDFGDPTRATSYPPNQIWAVVEMGHAGNFLGSIKTLDTFSRWDIFWSVAIALAKAEAVAEFEHRDLHEDNVCFRSIGGVINDPDIKELKRLGRGIFGHSGLRVTVIDYTLSRAIMEDEENGHRVAFNDLDKEKGLFSNPTDDMQRQTYNQMRNLLYNDDPCEDIWEPFQTKESKWDQYMPRTNVFWLFYLSQELRKRAEGKFAKSTKSKSKSSKRPLLGDLSGDSRFKPVEEGILSLPELLDEIMRKLEKTMEPRLKGSKTIQFDSAIGVVEHGIAQGWLTEGDVEWLEAHQGDD